VDLHGGSRVGLDRRDDHTVASDQGATIGSCPGADRRLVSEVAGPALVGTVYIAATDPSPPTVRVTVTGSVIVRPSAAAG
jgi:hypothetical protein